MPPFRFLSASGILAGGLLFACLVLSGCEKSEQITSYTVPKHDSLQSADYLEREALRHQADAARNKPVPKRMIGVIIPRESMLWFLKLEGNVEALAARENDVREFAKSVKFKPSENPKDAEIIDWKLPAGWKKLPDREMRYATLQLAGEPPQEMSVTQLPLQAGIELADQVLANVNRWRGQLMLRPIEKEELDAETEKLELDHSVAYWVNLVGAAIPKAGGMAPPHAPAGPAMDKAEPEEPKYEKPAEWQDAPPAAFAKVSLQVQDGDAKVAITVTPAGGERLANLNRWRGQVHLDPLTADQLAASAKTVQVGQKSGELYEFTNEGRTILGVIVDDRWYVKLIGDSQLAERERPRFEGFLKSLQLE